jgi:UDPglucose 6-dehydrogenase
MEVCVIGTGYVGLVTGTCLTFLGRTVTCVDIDEDKIAALNRGEVPFYEPRLKSLMGGGVQRGLLKFSTNLPQGVRNSEIIFIAVGTPPQPSGKPDLSAVEAVARSIGRSLDHKRHRIIVNKSTVPIGSGNWVEMLIKEGLRENPEARENTSQTLFSVASNPEFLREGTAIQDTLYPDRIVIGAADTYAIERLRALYEPIVEQTFNPPASSSRPADLTAVPVVTTDLASAEMIKYAANAFLATKISFANEIANICERVGADIKEVVRGFGLGSRIGPRFLNAGVGWGGSCFGKDLAALIDVAKEYGYSPSLLTSTVEVNRRQRNVIVQKLQETLKIIKGRRIGLLGLAFKPETDDLRDAPAIEIARQLLDMGARVKVHDPVAMEACSAKHPQLRVEYSPDPLSLASGCDALVLVTEWEQFQHLNPVEIGEAMNTKVIVDGRNMLDREEFEGAGFKYRAVGR